MIVEPIPIKRRVRFTRSGHPYIDEKTKADLERVRLAYSGKYYESESLTLIVEVFQRAPKSRHTECDPFTVKPDIDNVVKAVMDGLNGTAYRDDAQITQLYAVKHNRTNKLSGECVRFKLGTTEEMRSEVDRIREATLSPILL